MDEESPHLMGSKNICDFIKARGFPMRSGLDRTIHNFIRSIFSSKKFRFSRKGDIYFPIGGYDQNPIGRYVNEHSPVDIYLKQEHAEDLNHTLSLRSTLHQAKVPYEEIPSAKNTSRELQVTIRKLQGLDVNVNSI